MARPRGSREGEVPMPHRHNRIFNILAASAASVVVRLSGLLVQIITALYLTPEDFGVYAIGLSIAAVTFIMRGGGTGVFLQSMQPKEFKDMGGSLLRVSLVFSIFGCLLTLGAALPVHVFYKQEQLGWILLSLSVSNLIAMVGSFPRGKMLAELRFAPVAGIESAASLVKLAVAFWCARSGWGALTFALAQLSGELAKSITLLAFARLRKSDFSAPPEWIGTMASMLPLPLLIAIVTSLSEQGDTFLASWFVPVSVLGVYYFATQLTAQPFRLLAATIQSVLAPHSAQTRSDSKASVEAVQSAFLSGIVFMPLIVMSVPTCYPSASRLLWGHKWDATIWPVALSCSLLLYPTVLTILEGPLIGLRKWREVLRLMCLRVGSRLLGSVIGIILVLAAGLPPETAAITLVVSVGALSSIVCAIALRKSLLRAGIDRSLIDYELYITPLYSVLAAIGVHGLVTSLVPMMVTSDMSSRWVLATELLLSIAFYTIVSLVLLRFSYYEKLCLLLRVAHPAVRSPLTRLLAIPSSDLEPAAPIKR